MAFKPIAAKNAKVRINNTVLYAKEWTATPRISEADTTTFETGGQEDTNTSISGLDVSITLDWDGNGNLFDAPLSLQPGTDVSAKLYLNDVSGPFVNVPTLRILTVPVSAKVKENLGAQITGKARPGWSYPTGSA